MIERRHRFDVQPRRRRVTGLRVAAAVAAPLAVATLVLGIITGVATADVPAAAVPYTPTPGADREGLVPGTPCSSTARACVDLASHNAWLIRDGKISRGPVRFVDGDSADPTPPGTFKVEWKAREYTSREYVTPMPYSVFFAPGGIAFHQGGQTTPSAGCVKLEPADARAFFDDLQVGAEVQVK